MRSGSYHTGTQVDIGRSLDAHHGEDTMSNSYFVITSSLGINVLDFQRDPRGALLIDDDEETNAE